MTLCAHGHEITGRRRQKVTRKSGVKWITAPYCLECNRGRARAIRRGMVTVLVSKMIWLDLRDLAVGRGTTTNKLVQQLLVRGMKEIR